MTATAMERRLAHQCCWIVDDEECGLWCGHDGEHAPHQIGAYLPSPLIGPLDLLPLRMAGWLRRCPLCGTRSDSADCGPALVFRDGRYCESEMEAEWFFWPCGCEGREIIHPTEEEGLRHG